ncbi:hypothetical protein VITFI_CDS3196 [Vitreoscilla filiformis]|uniref:Uncharacterized protein n=1 Tax=Vitreoscilla filiformis TaxID=63 RepID=A0A221KJF4_VITFI|nr:hypothetical protein VITFI_CDS3196 [Vitreoscilla filiformis]
MVVQYWLAAAFCMKCCTSSFKSIKENAHFEKNMDYFESRIILRCSR